MSKYNGIAGSDGIGTGRVVLLNEQRLSYERRSSLNVAEETARFSAAVENFTEKTEEMAAAMRERIGEKESEILMGHVLMIGDPAISGEVSRGIDNGMTAETAVDEAFDMFAAMFEETDDELTKQRAADLRDIKTRLIRILQNAEETDISGLPSGSVIVAHDLTPSMTAGINKNNVLGIVTEVGGRTAHSAILARALEIPAVLGISGVTENVKNGDMIIVDGSEGKVISCPSDEESEHYKRLKHQSDLDKKELLKYIGKPTVTADGTEVELLCNIGKPEECSDTLEHSGEGVGLFRTEFLYMDKQSAPTEAEQFEAYKKAALIMKGKPIIIRTLDIGGDKNIPYMHLEKEENPFLGFRAVRYCVQHRELYAAQLRALLRASAFGDIRIMIPLVTCVDEVCAVKKMIRAIMSELDENETAYNKNIKIGVMIETPAAAIMADVLAKEVDFFSIGTNDLTGYTMAVDRGNANVSYLYSAYNPAVIRIIKRIIRCGKAEGITVGMCGEAAADPLLTPLLVSFGLDEFSVSPSSVLKTRKAISDCSKKDADKIAEEALKCSTEHQVKEVLEKYKR